MRARTERARDEDVIENAARVGHVPAQLANAFALQLPTHASNVRAQQHVRDRRVCDRLTIALRCLHDTAHRAISASALART
jgi:hypothetical protein